MKVNLELYPVDKGTVLEIDGIPVLKEPASQFRNVRRALYLLKKMKKGSKNWRATIWIDE